MANTHDYYNPVGAQTDYRQGMGYAKAQKIPSQSTGLGSMFAMGWDTGIYPPEDEYDECEEIDLPFEDEEELRDFFVKVNRGYTSADSVRPRADMSSYGSSSNRFSTVGLSEQTKIHTIKGISPIPAKTKYPSGLGMATGGSSSAFGSTRTAPGKRGGYGTQFGFSRKPLDQEDDYDSRIMSLLDILDMSDDERNFLKHQRKIKNTLEMVENLLHV